MSKKGTWKAFSDGELDDFIEAYLLNSMTSKEHAAGTA